MHCQIIKFAMITKVSLLVTTLMGVRGFHTNIMNRYHHPSRSLVVLGVSSSSSSSSERKSKDLPDYGKTSIEIDKHTLNNKDNKEDNNKWRRKDLFGKSLIQQTVDEMSNNVEFQETTQKMEKIGTIGMTKEERTRRRRALDSLGVPSFNKFLYQQQMQQQQEEEQQQAGSSDDEFNSEKGTVTLMRKQAEVLQINVGLYCNQACVHCHVESSPLRSEMMNEDVAAQCIKLLESTPSIHTLDITGGAPELNNNFRFIVSMVRDMEDKRKADGKEIRQKPLDIIDRCNLTVLQEPGQEDLIEFLVKHKVHIVASLPCYSADNVDTQRGNGVFDRSMSGLLALNEAGYGQPNTDLKLDLVYNPLGAFLPPPQQNLESKYKEVLKDNFDIDFNSLFTMTNMPVKRFTDFLYRRNELKDYMDLLVRNFNSDTMDSLMCKNTISVGYDGRIFDCDFNQQLGYTIGANDEFVGGKTVFDINSLNDLQFDTIKNDNHCFGCTAGMGSS